MKLRLLALGLMLSLMPPCVESRTVSQDIIYINRFIESLPYMLESDIRVDGSGDPATPWSKWLKGRSYVEIPYYLSGYLTREKWTIRLALYSVESMTCIRFKEISLLDTLQTRPYLHIYPGSGCWSYIGFKWAMRRQYLSLSRLGCLTRPIIQHIMMHALGFTHEQSRPDRDKYLTIYFNNVHPMKRHFFNKYGKSNQVTSYDYNSILHIDSQGYTRSATKTLLPKKSSPLRFGHATQMSSLDRLKINRYYECTSYL